jgi:hypothetical protein
MFFLFKKFLSQKKIFLLLFCFIKPFTKSTCIGCGTTPGSPVPAGPPRHGGVRAVGPSLHPHLLVPVLPGTVGFSTPTQYSSTTRYGIPLLSLIHPSAYRFPELTIGLGVEAKHSARYLRNGWDFRYILYRMYPIFLKLYLYIYFLRYRVLATLLLLSPILYL